MKLIFLGHQGWYLASATTGILIDPVLEDAITTGAAHGWKIGFFPPRVVDHEALPKVDAILLSHEHPDHFNLPTLARFDRSTPVIVGPLMLESVVAAIEALGFTVTRQPLRTPFSVGDVHGALYPASAEDIGYERRVTQMLLWSDAGASVYNLVDCHLSTAFARDLAAGLVPAPAQVIVTNNSMLPSDAGRRAYYNIAPKARDTREGFGCLQEMLAAVPGLPSAEHVIIAGNGLLPYDGEFGPFIWADNRELAELANELSQGPTVYGPLPGEGYELGAAEAPSERLPSVSCSWLRVDREAMAALELRAAAAEVSNAEPLFPVLTEAFSSEAEARRGLAEVEAELGRLAEVLPVTAFGRSLAVIDDPGWPQLGPRRFVLRLVGGPDGRVLQYAFDVNAVAFLPDETAAEELVDVFPHGLEMHLCDFHAIISGRFPALNLFSAPVKTWFLESKEMRDEQILAGLAAIYGEQSRPELARSIHLGIVAELRSGAAPSAQKGA